MSYIEIDELMDKTGGGLEIIASYYPDAPAALSSRTKKFKARPQEKTPSAAIKQNDQGWYCVTDFGGDGKMRNAVEIAMYEEGLTFVEAIKELAARFGLSGSKPQHGPKPTIETRPRQKDDAQAGTYEFSFTDWNQELLSYIGPYVEEEDTNFVRFKPVEFFEYFSKDKVTRIIANGAYPIYVFDYGTWQKIYQPFAQDPGNRFRFAGEKPQTFIFGLEHLEHTYRKHQESLEDYEKDDKERPGDKLEAAFFVSGGSDGLNLKSLGYLPLWLNSETEKLSYGAFSKISSMVDTVFYIGDIDSTGEKQTIKFGMQFLEARLVFLPSWLKELRDRRGKPRKDLKDYITTFKGSKVQLISSIKGLLRSSLPMKFWEEYYSEKTLKYAFKNSRAYQFLHLNGFGRLPVQNAKEGFTYVYKKDGVVRTVKPFDIKNHINQFLIDRQQPEDLRDMVYRNSGLSENYLVNLPQVEIDFTDCSREDQFFFFQNEAWRVSALGIERTNYKSLKNFTWEESILPRRVKISEPLFTIEKDANANWDIQINSQESWYFNYLINTSRVHWQAELEEGLSGVSDKKKEDYLQKHKFSIDGPNLTEDQVFAQKLHLINKIYALGYMLHKYKNPARPWALYAMDHKIAEISESHGGSGKSIFLKSIAEMLQAKHYINGRDRKKTGDDFIYHGVTEHTDYILVDDCHAYTDYGFFFNAITGDLDVNNKNGLRYIIPFAESPKIAFASNYPPNDLDPSLERRLLFVVFSDYYHYNKDGEYQESRIVSDEFGGKSLFIDFDQNQWNLFFNFCAQALQFYLANPDKLDPPLGNVQKRNLQKVMGEHFQTWADGFFSTDNRGYSSYLNQLFDRKSVFKRFQEETGLKKWTQNRFKKALDAFCKFNGWELNPDSETDAKGRIIKWDTNMETGKKEPREKFYIRTELQVDPLTTRIEVEAYTEVDNSPLDGISEDDF